MTTISINEKTTKQFSRENLERFVNSSDFEDLVLGYHMIKWRTRNTQSLNSFKKDIWFRN